MNGNMIMGTLTQDVFEDIFAENSTAPEKKIYPFSMRTPPLCACLIYIHYSALSCFYHRYLVAAAAACVNFGVVNCTCVSECG